MGRRKIEKILYQGVISKPKKDIKEVPIDFKIDKDLVKNKKQIFKLKYITVVPNKCQFCGQKHYLSAILENSKGKNLIIGLTCLRHTKNYIFIIDNILNLVEREKFSNLKKKLLSIARLFEFRNKAQEKGYDFLTLIESIKKSPREFKGLIEFIKDYDLIKKKLTFREIKENYEFFPSLDTILKVLKRINEKEDIDLKFDIH